MQNHPILLVLIAISVVVLAFSFFVGWIPAEMIVWIFLSGFTGAGVYIWLHNRQ